MINEAQLYHYGLGAGLPYRTLASFANAVALARNAGDVSRRKSIAREILTNSRWKNFISQETCYARVQPDTLPGTAEVLQILRDIIKERRKAGWHQSRVNPVDHLELPEHFRDHPQLLNFALSDTMLQIVSGYYGMVPQLKEIGIWVTRPQTDRGNSQLFHLDKPESKIIGLFLNIENNGVEQGPFTFIPAGESAKIRKGTNYESSYFRGDGYLSDDVVLKFTRRENQISTEGGPGTGIFVDTSNCFHFGSRCQAGERIMMMVKFMLPHRARKPRTPLFDLTPKPKDELRRLVLCGTEFGNG
jgi:hypothetical protein